jgi:hypothetical protein
MNRRGLGLFLTGTSALVIGAALGAWLGSRQREFVASEPLPAGREELELMRRLVRTVERFETAAADDRAAQERDRNREKRAIVVVIWTLVTLVVVDAVQHDPVGQFVAANWNSVPVALPVIGLAAAFVYRAFRIQFFRLPFVYGVAALTMLISAEYLLGLSDYHDRVIGIGLGLVGLFYLVRAALYDRDGNLTPGAVEIATLISRRERLVRVVFLVPLVVIAFAAVWYVGSDAPRADLLGFVRYQVSFAFLLAALSFLMLLDRRERHRSRGRRNESPAPQQAPRARI